MGAAVAGIEAAALVALAVAYAVGLGAHTESSGPRTLASMALFLVGAMLLGAVARAYLRVMTWQRMASLVANALLIPVGISVVRGNGALIGIPVLALALAGVVAALLTRTADPDPG